MASKNYQLTKEELKYLEPLDAVKRALESQMTAFVIAKVLNRLGIELTPREYSRVHYSVDAGEVVVLGEDQ